MSSPGLSMLLLFCASTHLLIAQELAPDSAKTVIAPLPANQKNRGREYRFTTGKLIVPSLLITGGILSLTTNGMKKLNGSTRYEIIEHQPKHTLWDNYTQYAPAVMVYGLNMAGVNSKHNLYQRTMIYTTAQLVTAAIVIPLKHATREERPDASNHQSFPSGHTATAFSSAQFLFREFRFNNFWLSITGYPIAVFTGVYRTLNNKHWVGDVFAGAGIGILATEIAYRLFPVTNQLLGGKKHLQNKILLPQYAHGSYGLIYTQTF